MDTYEILRWVNQTLQGQFRKYPSVINQVIDFCTTKDVATLEEAKEKFSLINFAVARILSGCEEDTPEVVGYANKCNNYSGIPGVLRIEQVWIDKRLLKVGSVVEAEDQQGNRKTGKVKTLGWGVQVKFDDGSDLTFSGWRESSYREFIDSQYKGANKSVPVPNHFVIKKVY